MPLAMGEGEGTGAETLAALPGPRCPLDGRVAGPPAMPHGARSGRTQASDAGGLVVAGVARVSGLPLVRGLVRAANPHPPLRGDLSRRER